MHKQYPTHTLSDINLLFLFLSSRKSEIPSLYSTDFLKLQRAIDWPKGVGYRSGGDLPLQYINILNLPLFSTLVEEGGTLDHEGMGRWRRCQSFSFSRVFGFYHPCHYPQTHVLPFVHCRLWVRSTRRSLLSECWSRIAGFSVEWIFSCHKQVGTWIKQSIVVPEKAAARSVVSHPFHAKNKVERSFTIS